MQCGELIYHTIPTMTKGSSNQNRPEKETIHSGHFMVSHFEAEAQDDEDDLAVALPEEDEVDPKLAVFGQPALSINTLALVGSKKDEVSQQQISIETSLNKLFQCMTLAYRQKLTSPKWNRFKGIKLRWKDKIRLNNVIWRCWHMQFIMKQSTLVCQFASPLDVDTHIKPEATILEGKYWKRRAEAVKAEYKKWRMYYRNRALGWGNKDVSDVISDMDVLDWHSQGDDNSHMLVDEDYIEFMSDTLFSTITSNQPFAFPDTREIARGASLADFIQPSLGPLQPNLDDFMDTFEPLQELLSVAKLPPVPEETITSDDNAYRNTFSQALMDPNLQHALEQTTHFQNSQMDTQHMQHLPPHDQLMAQESLSEISSVSQTSPNLESHQSAHGGNILSRQGQNANFLAQVGNHTGNNQSPSNIIANMVTQSQALMMQPPAYGILTSNVINQQNAGTGTMLGQQNSLSNSPQQQMQKNAQQYMQNQKIYPHVPIGGYQDRNFNVTPVMHQSRVDSVYITPNRIHPNPGSTGFNPERSRRSLAPALAQAYGQYVTTTAQQLTDKSSYNEQCMERSINVTQQPQQISLKASAYVRPIQDQSVAANLSLGNTARFKMPSPPPQVSSNSQQRVSQQNQKQSPQQQQQQHQQKQTQQQQSHQQVTKTQQPIKTENFRSNSLPLGATLGSVLGVAGSSGTSGGSGQTGRGRRARSGSCSPAPPQRRGPAPLLTAASEPLLKETSVLLAHLLNKGQGLYKAGSAQNLPTDSIQTHPVAIIQASAVLTPVTPTTTSSSIQLIPFTASPPASAPSPQSPLSPCGGDGRGGDHRRAGHIHAEQKRRYNIKNGFDLLQSLIPQLSQNPNAKVSKAAMLQKGAEYIKQLQAERTNMKDEMDQLRQQIETLNSSISNCLSLLPATGAPVSRQRSGRLKEMFDEYVSQRTNENWKFWIFSLLVDPLLTSFNNCVSPASTEELKRSTYLWAEQHCSLVEMRPAVLNSLRVLCTSTDILSHPEKLPDEARAAVNNRKKESETFNFKK